MLDAGMCTPTKESRLQLRAVARPLALSSLCAAQGVSVHIAHHAQQVAGPKTWLPPTHSMGQQHDPPSPSPAN